MAELWRMAQGRLRTQRELTLSLASLVWSLGQMSQSDVANFIGRGSLEFNGKASGEPYNEQIHGRLIRGR